MTRSSGVGKYVIQKKLGAGGMGTVFLAALDEDLNRPVALKVLPREKAENPVLVKRFKAEAQSAAQLHHRNIVGVCEAGQADGLLYIALEYINGNEQPSSSAAAASFRSSGRSKSSAAWPRRAARGGTEHRPPRHQAVQRHDL